MVVFQIACGGTRPKAVQIQGLRKRMHKVLSSRENRSGLYLFESTRDEISASSGVTLYRMRNLHQKMSV